MALPSAYAWLQSEGAPKILVEALKLFGVAEKAGPQHNPIILGWLKELGFTWINDDETPWCGTFMGIVAKRAGKPVHIDAARAKSWLKWGTGVTTPMLGDVLVFDRQGGGHVGLYVGEDATHYHVLGGNQANCVCIVRILKTRLTQARRTAWTSAQPANVRRVWLSPKGAHTSINEV
ncbi:TIGR02594 family protein [Solirubrum puertoriconensis]|uniref:TIGR02594 family protein n=1 Tax=Solirubrum puertoriconensis TaxID=1751427 RepID=A0A9X0HJ67_SOLP1|nr:TIGR02594 family protein [Solirubrum puertoriconensis]KUG06872.1 hypothetical protein ASU33_05985 [Solirubrum puertoriconensis]